MMSAEVIYALKGENDIIKPKEKDNNVLKATHLNNL